MKEKKWPPWQGLLLLIWPYVALAANLLLIRIGMAAWLGGLLGTLLVTVLNMRVSLTLQDSFTAARWTMLVKLIHIPAYVLGLMMTPLIWVAPPLVLGLLLTNVCMLLASSAYSLRAIYLTWRAGGLAPACATALAVSQCIFVMDVPGSIAIYAIEKRRSC